MRKTKNIWECDRCGKQLVFESPGLTKEQEKEASRWTSHMFYTVRGKEVYLCPMCSDEYLDAKKEMERRFLEGGSKKERKKD